MSSFHINDNLLLELTMDSPTAGDDMRGAAALFVRGVIRQVLKLDPTDARVMVSVTAEGHARGDE